MKICAICCVIFENVILPLSWIFYCFLFKYCLCKCFFYMLLWSVKRHFQVRNFFLELTIASDGEKFYERFAKKRSNQLVENWPWHNSLNFLNVKTLILRKFSLKFEFQFSKMNFFFFKNYWIDFNDSSISLRVQKCIPSFHNTCEFYWC